jgi:glutathionyl-hydroquinone reductase
MKTAMQEFIEQNFYINADGEYEAKWTEDTLWTDQIKNALEKEKEQIIIAHDQGIWPTPKAFDDGKDYYNQTYNK